MSRFQPFTLCYDEVPDPPSSHLYRDQLRWLLCVMDPLDTRLPFIARCYAVSIESGGLSPDESRTCQAILNTVCKAFSEGILICQNSLPPEEDQPATELETDDEEPPRRLN